MVSNLLVDSHIEKYVIGSSVILDQTCRGATRGFWGLPASLMLRAGDRALG